MMILTAWRRFRSRSLRFLHAKGATLIPGVVLLAAVIATSGAATPAVTGVRSTVACAPDNGGITLPEGLCASVFADLEGLAPRHMAVDTDGDVYVRLRGNFRMRRSGNATGGLAALRDADGDGVAETVERFDDTFGTGVELHDGYLYYSDRQTIYRRRFEGDELVPSGAPEVVVEGFPRQGQHADKPFTFDGAGHIYVNVGAPSNACQTESRTPGSPGQDPCPQRDRQAGIWRFDADRLGQTQADGVRYAAGIRNAVAIQWNDAAGRLFALQHGRDSLFDLWGDLYTLEESAELPSEEFLAVDEGDDFGWPYCYNDHFRGEKVLAPEYGGDGSEVGRCAEAEAPAMAFPGHWAPNDLVFYDGEELPARYRGGAFIAFHGSWNRAPLEQQGYRVTFVPFADGMPAGEPESFATGFTGVDELMDSRRAEYRPTGLAVAPDGSLYISADTGGRIWKVVSARAR